MKILSVDGQEVLDFIDYNYFCTLEDFNIAILEPNGVKRDIAVHKRSEEPIGIDIAEDLYPMERSCANHCVFCFIDQLPAHMRESLYYKDDDWRYSLLFGNFVTLTNIGDREIERLIQRKVSPIYISVHATDPLMRCTLMGNNKAGDIMEKLTRLAEGGITFHCQIVLCPGYNDGEVLRDTMQTLYSLYPAARTVAVVPLGMTKFRENLSRLTSVTSSKAAEVIDQVERFAKQCQLDRGVTFAYASDEFYQIAERPWPKYEDGGHIAQSSNGVGLMSEFIEGFLQAAKVLKQEAIASRHVLLATGEAAAPTLDNLIKTLMADHPQLQAEVITVRNHFFGEQITVAGLLTGQDILSALRSKQADEILIPAAALKDGCIFLDDMTLNELQNQLGIPIEPVPDDGFSLAFAILGKIEE